MLQLDRRRRLSGKTFSDLARALGVPQKRISRFFTKDGPMRLNEIERLAALLPEDATNGSAAAVGETTISGPVNGNVEVGS